MPPRKKRKGGRRRRRDAGRAPLKDVLITSAGLGFLKGRAAQQGEQAIFNRIPQVGGVSRTGVLGVAAYFFRKKNKWVNAMAYSALASAVEQIGVGGFQSLRGDDLEGDSVSGEMEVDEDDEE